ncbi:MAG: DNA polymerase I, partial [Nitrospinae bacterium]|nr:DNA polymerase I [Nitrospinota bacterium]
MAKKAEKKGFTTFMMTPDKDFCQLVSENIFIYKPPSFGNEAQVLGIAEVCKKFEIEKPEQVIDILGLWGDSVDNIPGVPGIGEKTAKKLIGEFGSIENVFKNTDKLKGKLKENIEENKEKAIMSRNLATIECEVPLEFDEKELILKPPDTEALKEIFNELEFRRLAERVFRELTSSFDKEQETQTVGANRAIPGIRDDTVVQKKTEREKDDTGQINMFDQANTPEDIRTTELNNINTVKHNYHLTDTPEKRSALINDLLKQRSICFDTETTGFNIHNLELVGFSFAFNPHEAYYVPVPENIDDAQAIVNEFKTLFENENIEKIGQNLKYDISVLKKYDVEVRGKFFDTMLAHYLI